MKFNLAVHLLSASAILAFLAASWSPAKSGARVPGQGEILYKANCEASHMTGQNVIKPEKDLITSSKLASESLFKEFLKEKHGYMPAFPEVAAQDKDLHALYKYVRKLKAQSWEYEPATPEIKQDPEEMERPN